MRPFDDYHMVYMMSPRAHTQFIPNTLRNGVLTAHVRPCSVTHRADESLFSNVIFEKNTTEPTNYTIVFKYIGSDSSPTINFAEVDTHDAQVSHAIMNSNHNDY